MRSSDPGAKWCWAVLIFAWCYFALMMWGARERLLHPCEYLPRPAVSTAAPVPGVQP